MNKKALVTLIVGVVVIVIIVLLLLRSCTPRVKEVAGENGTAEPSIDAQYRTGFINANIFFTCEILKDATLKDDKKNIEVGVNAAYEKYGLPVDDNATMIKILEKYNNDAEVTAIIKTNATPCRGGQEPIFVQ